MLSASSSNVSAPATEEAVRDTTLATFMADVIEGSKAGLVLVEFGASWCGPCKTLTPLLEKIARESNGGIRLCKIDIDRNQQIAQQMGVQSVPSVFAFVGGRPVDGFAGALPEQQIRAWLMPLLQKAGGPVAEQKAMIESALSQAAAFLAEKDLVTAQAVYADILDMDPTCAAAYAGLVRCALDGGDAAKALQMIDDAPADIAKDKALDPLRAALDLVKQAADAGPVAELERKVAASPDDHQARFDLAVALFAAGKREDAVEHLLTIVGRARSWNEDAARKQLVKFFEALGNADPLTVSARRRLSSLLFS